MFTPGFLRKPCIHISNRGKQKWYWVKGPILMHGQKHSKEHCENHTTQHKMYKGRDKVGELRVVGTPRGKYTYTSSKYCTA